MVPEETKAPLDEQKICVTCGFCCDGTLFHHAMLRPGEKGNLPEKIDQNYRREKDEEFFLLPCLYFSEKCTIYDQKRAQVCSGYRCQLLGSFEAGKIDLESALKVVGEARRMRTEIEAQFRKLSGHTEGIHFRQLLLDLGKIMKSASPGKTLDMDLEILAARCNILEALMIKHFRSAEAFEKLIMK